MTIVNVIFAILFTIN